MAQTGMHGIYINNRDQLTHSYVLVQN